METNMTTYRVQGYTGALADFDFHWTANTNSLFGVSLRDAILSKVKKGSLWEENFSSLDINFDFELGPDQERSDLRDTDSQRVYLVDSIYCNLDQNIFETEHDCSEDNCERDSYMITVDVIE